MKTPQVTRRQVLQGMAVAASTPVWIRYVEPAWGLLNGSNGDTRHILIVHLNGGNDPLHTIAPIGDPRFLALRPSVGLRETDMNNMGNGFGMNKNLPTLFNFWQAGQLAVINQVGTLKNNLSHTGATRQWETGSPEDRFNTGWLGRYLDSTTGHGPIRAAAFGDQLPLTLTGAQAESLTLDSIADFAFSDAAQPDASARHRAVTEFASFGAPQGSLLADVIEAQRQMVSAADPVTQMTGTKVNGRVPTQADNVAQLFAAGLGTEIGYLMVPLFDTHANERHMHQNASNALEGIIGNFFNAANALGVAESSAVVVFTEFGRRVYENRSEGTDHGTAGSVYVVGPSVKGGMYGPRLDLSQLDNGNLPTAIDLRSVYASVLDGWLRTDPAAILGSAYPTLDLFRNVAVSSPPPVVAQPPATPAVPIEATSADNNLPVINEVEKNTGSVGKLVRNVLSHR